MVLISPTAGRMRAAVSADQRDGVGYGTQKPTGAAEVSGGGVGRTGVDPNLSARIAPAHSASDLVAAGVELGLRAEVVIGPTRPYGVAVAAPQTAQMRKRRLNRAQRRERLGFDFRTTQCTAVYPQII